MRKLSPHVTAVLVSVLLFGLGQVAAHQLAQEAPAPASTPLSTAFTYQGRLMNGATPASGTYALIFRLYDAPTAGFQVGVDVRQTLTITNGLFTTQLDFGSSVFDGAQRWLGIEINHEPLLPRYPLTAAPYALYTLKAAQATAAQTATLALSAQAVPWSGISGIPADLADGDADTTYTAGRGLLLSGTEFRAQGSPYANTLVVARSGGDFTSIQAAINSITLASADNPYAIFVASGVYTEQVTLKPYVTLVGAGQAATIIRWFGGAQEPSVSAASATVSVPAAASLRQLSIESRSSGQSIMLGVYASGACQLQDISVTTVGGVKNYAVYTTAGAPQLHALTVNASGGQSTYGIYNAGSAALIERATVTAAGQLVYGVLNDGGAPQLRDVVISASAGSSVYAVQNLHTSATLARVTVYAAAQQQSRGVDNVAAQVQMSDIEVHTTSLTSTYALYSISSALTLTDVLARATDAATIAGLVAFANSTVTLRGGSIATSGGSSTYGILAGDSLLSLSAVTISGAGTGIYNANSTLRLRDAAVSGSVYSIYRASGAVQVANSQLVGVLTVGLTCFGTYDASLAPLTCP